MNNDNLLNGQTYKQTNQQQKNCPLIKNIYLESIQTWPPTLILSHCKKIYNVSLYNLHPNKQILKFKRKIEAENKTIKEDENKNTNVESTFEIL